MRGVALISGGIDSPVAAKLVLNKGHELIGLHFSYEPYTDNSPEIKARKVCEKLGMPLKVVNIGEKVKQIAQNCDRKYYFVLTKRLMMRLAEKEKKQFIVTGESVAQVSSQTLQNLKIIDQAVKTIIIRPLIGLDKEEIISLAKKFGTYELSVGPEVCDVLGPKHPITCATLEKTLREEQKLRDLV